MLKSEDFIPLVSISRLFTSLPGEITIVFTVGSGVTRGANWSRLCHLLKGRSLRFVLSTPTFLLWGGSQNSHISWYFTANKTDKYSTCKILGWYEVLCFGRPDFPLVMKQDDERNFPHDFTHFHRLHIHFIFIASDFHEVHLPFSQHIHNLGYKLRSSSFGPWKSHISHHSLPRRFSGTPWHVATSNRTSAIRPWAPPCCALRAMPCVPPWPWRICGWHGWWRCSATPRHCPSPKATRPWVGNIWENMGK